MSQVLDHLPAVVRVATMLAGLVLAIAWRDRLGRAGTPAIAGFGTLMAIELIGLGWRPRPGKSPWSQDGLDLLAGLPAADLAIYLTLSAAYPVGLGLLVLAVLRGPYRMGEAG